MKKKSWIFRGLFFFGYLNALGACAATFTHTPLPEGLAQAFVKEKRWHPGCPVALNRLHLLTVSYFDFDGREKRGQLVVYDAAAPLMLQAFKSMYEQHFPLQGEKMAGAAANGVTPFADTVAFNCRDVTGEHGFYSLHSYGLAIDINVKRNPYIGEYKVTAQGSVSAALIPNTLESFQFLNRSQRRAGMNEDIVKIMGQAGFIVWGGQWQDRMDYMHFQVPDAMAKNLAFLALPAATRMMELIRDYPQSALKMSADSKWKLLYHLYPDRYMAVLSLYFPHLATTDEHIIFNQVYEKLASGSP